jgi:hypothetical protein
MKQGLSTLLQKASKLFSLTFYAPDGIPLIETATLRLLSSGGAATSSESHRISVTEVEELSRPVAVRTGRRESMMSCIQFLCGISALQPSTQEPIEFRPECELDKLC